MTRGQAPAEGRCEHGAAYNGRLCRKCHPLPVVFVRRDLARRILAALEDPDGPGTRPAALAAELRLLVERGE